LFVIFAQSIIALVGMLSIVQMIIDIS